MAQTAPIGPGVPALLSGYNSVVQPLTMVTADAEMILRLIAGPTWGIFSADGTPILFGNYFGSAVADVSYEKDYVVATFPVEAGSFASYDKVEQPYHARVTVSVGGSIASRLEALATVEDLIASLTLVSVATPEEVYANANIVHVGYDRSAMKGAGLLHLDIWLEEIRVTAVANSGNAAQPNGANPVNGGVVQTAPVTGVQSSSIATLGVQ